MIDVVQPQLFKHLEPERAELDETVVVGLGLFQHGADNGRDREDRLQADGKTHRAQQLEQGFAEEVESGVHLGGKYPVGHK